MNEFIVLVRNDSEHQATWSTEQHRQFLADFEEYINNLSKDQKIKSSRQRARRGRIKSDTKGPLKQDSFDKTNELIVGYYHIFAEALNDAIMIAKGSPEFEYSANARIEVQPVKISEEITGYVFRETAN